MLRTPSGHVISGGEESWTHDSFREDCYVVAAALQRLAGAAYFGSRERFEATARHVAALLPTPRHGLEADWLREKLRHAAGRASLDFHRRQGCDPKTCPVDVLDRRGLLWNTPRITPRGAFLRTLGAFFKAFDAWHPLIGVPVRTAKLLRRTWHTPPAMAEVARRLGYSRSRIEALFRERYALTPHAYRERVRLRAAVLHLRRDHDKLEYVARCAAYSSTWNLHLALMKHTGMAARQIRDLRPSQVQVLLTGPLDIDLARLHERRHHA